MTIFELWGALLHGGPLSCVLGQGTGLPQVGRPDSRVARLLYVAHVDAVQLLIDLDPQYLLKGVSYLLTGGEALSVVPRLRGAQGIAINPNHQRVRSGREHRVHQHVHCAPGISRPMRKSRADW